MKIGIFSKFDLSGGSEMRGIELANSLRPAHESFIFCQGKMTQHLKSLAKVPVYEHIFKKRTEALYDLDCLLVINTDSRSFTTLAFWTGNTEKQQTFVNLTKIKQMVFLFNYIISPVRNLPEIEQYCPNLKIITTNTKFFLEIPKKHQRVIHLPRIILESPINPESVSPFKTKSDKIRVGCLSKPVHDKWNEDWQELIKCVNSPKIQWRFLGCPDSLQEKLNFENIEFNKEFSITVKDFLQNLDIFVYLPNFSREEPWSRSIAEALLSGCPVITSAKGGNVDQITHGNNGFLCSNLEDFKQFTTHLCNNQHIISKMQKICLKKSQYFTSDKIISKLVDFIQW